TGRFVLIQGAVGNSDNTNPPNWTNYLSYSFASGGVGGIDMFKMYDAGAQTTFADPVYRVTFTAYCPVNTPASGTPAVTRIMFPVLVRLDGQQVDGSSVSSDNSVRRNRFRAIVPGLYVSNVNANAGDNHPLTITVAGVAFVLLRTYNANTHFISLGDWY
ncbi:MAG: hypothetical protein ACRDA8_11860, partial [Shewanella sp.]